jgi:hypothetical protein
MNPPIDSNTVVGAEVEAPEDEEKLVQKWTQKIEHARSHDRRAREQWAEDRAYARGESKYRDGANLIASQIEILLSFLYAKDPDVSAEPTPSTDRARLKHYRKLGETLQIVVSRLLKDARLKHFAKKWLRSAMTVGVGWLKASMTTKKEKSPIVQNQLNDLAQQLERLESLTVQVAMDDGKPKEALIAEIKLQMVALQAKLELTVNDGFVIDPVAAEDVIVAPECSEIIDYLSSPWIAIRSFKTKDEVLQITKWTKEEAECLQSANLYSQKPPTGEAEPGKAPIRDQFTMVGSDERAQTQDGFYAVFEIWSKNDSVVLTMIEGLTKKWARAPYAPRQTKRFYDLFLLAFHPIDGERWPQSDVYQLKKLQDEYSRTRSTNITHRRRAVPGMLFNARTLTKTDVENMAKGETNEYIGLEGLEPGADIRTAVMPKAYPPVDPMLYDTSEVRAEIEKVSGAQEALAGAVSVEKTATEAKIQDSGFGARTDNRRDAFESSLSELAEFCGILAAQMMTPQEVELIAGQGAPWVTLTVEEAIAAFNIQIKAGSSGRPKTNSDREAWGVLLPLVKETIGQVGAIRRDGPQNEWLATPLIALLKETFKRLDDPADVDDFLPTPPPVDPMQMIAQALGGGAAPGAPGAAPPAPGAPIQPEPFAPPAGPPAPIPA